MFLNYFFLFLLGWDGCMYTGGCHHVKDYEGSSLLSCSVNFVHAQYLTNEILFELQVIG